MLAEDYTQENPAQFGDGKEVTQTFTPDSKDVKGDQTDGMYDWKVKGVLNSNVRPGNVTLNPGKLTEFGPTAKGVVIAHELGHGLGATHGSVNDVMNEGKYNTAATKDEATNRTNLRNWTADIAGAGVDKKFKEDNKPQGADKLFDFILGLAGRSPYQKMAKPSSAVDKNAELSPPPKKE
jgi:hypothetical protein